MVKFSDIEWKLIDRLVETSEQQPDGPTRRLLEVIVELTEVIGPNWRDRLRRRRPTLYSDVKVGFKALCEIEDREWCRSIGVDPDNPYSADYDCEYEDDVVNRGRSWRAFADRIRLFAAELANRWHRWLILNRLPTPA